jgi:AraC-like DNA-binding protein
MLIAGIAECASQVPMAGSVSYFGIRFLPAGINYFVKFPLHLIHNRIVEAANLPVGSMDQLADRVYEKKDFAERVKLSEFLLLKQLAKQNTTLHPALVRALHHILHNGGDISIETKTAEWISPRQLRRLFHEHIGCPPKLFARITRFQKTLYTMQYGKPAERTNSFYQHGYTDQAHFIREFKLLYGNTPRYIGKINGQAPLL